MQTENRLQLNYSLDHGIDWQRCGRKVLRNRVLIQMLPEAASVNGILLPDKVGANLRPDVGVVLSVPNGCQWIKCKPVEYPEPGSLVVVRPYDGTRLTEDSGIETRVYGCWFKYPGHPLACDWFDSIVCQIMEDQTLKAYVDKIILRLDPKEEKEGMLILPDSVQTRNAMATVVSVGANVDGEVKVGARVCYNPELLAKEGLRFDLNNEAKDLAVCTELAINYVEVAA